jgi:hypothetical protein
MMLRTLALGLLTCFPAMVQAETGLAGSVLRFDIETSSNSRGGNDLNSSGFPFAEIEDFDLTAIDAQLAVPFENGVTLQFGVRHDVSHAPTSVFLSASDDTYRKGTLVSAQLGQQFEQGYGGAFLAAGQVAFNPSDADQDADLRSFGFQGAYHWERATVGGVFGVLDTTADNPETLANATFLGVNAGYYFGNDQTRLSGSFTVFDGQQDIDSGGSPDPVRATVASLELEHAFLTRGSYQLSGFVGYDRIDVKETSSSGIQETTSDDLLSLGLRVVFGASAPRQRERVMTPDLPDMLRLLGAVPAVD